MGPCARAHIRIQIANIKNNILMLTIARVEGYFISNHHHNNTHYNNHDDRNINK